MPFPKIIPDSLCRVAIIHNRCNVKQLCLPLLLQAQHENNNYQFPLLESLTIVWSAPNVIGSHGEACGSNSARVKVTIDAGHGAVVSAIHTHRSSDDVLTCGILDMSFDIYLLDIGRPRESVNTHIVCFDLGRARKGWRVAIERSEAFPLYGGTGRGSLFS